MLTVSLGAATWTVACVVVLAPASACGTRNRDISCTGIAEYLPQSMSHTHMGCHANDSMPLLVGTLQVPFPSHGRAWECAGAIN